MPLGEPSAILEVSDAGEHHRSRGAVARKTWSYPSSAAYCAGLTPPGHIDVWLGSTHDSK